MKSQLLLATIGASAQALVTQGRCQDLQQVPGMQNLDAQSITGVWFPAFVDKQEVQSQGFQPKCLNVFIEVARESNYWKYGQSDSDSEDEEQQDTMEATDLAEGSERFFNRIMQFGEGRVSGLLYTVDIMTQGEATATGWFFGKTTTGRGVLVDTDYDNYVIGYMCE